MVQAEVHVDPIGLIRLGEEMLRSSQQIADAWRVAQSALAISTAAFGDTAGGYGLHDAHKATVDDADVAAGRLVAVLEGDMDRLYRVAFSYQKADEDAARRLQQQHPTSRSERLGLQ